MKILSSLGIASVIVAVVGFGVMFCFDWSTPATSVDVKAMQKALIEKDATIVKLKAAAAVYAVPADKLDVAAKAGLTEQPGWQLQKILEHGGDGSVFYQLEASTRGDGNVSTVGPHGFSWRTTTDDALKAAKLRRGDGDTEVKEAEPPK